MSRSILKLFWSAAGSFSAFLTLYLVAGRIGGGSGVDLVWEQKSRLAAHKAQVSELAPQHSSPPQPSIPWTGCINGLCRP
ncbi:hypothetical protein BGZ57DRAFT_917042 [Hyaloscypha finlandica]|nr:hypothetical protein BGZ57DRAFT_917042 [Hyaloscypha finlandica]